MLHRVTVKRIIDLGAGSTSSQTQEFLVSDSNGEDTHMEARIRSMIHPNCGMEIIPLPEFEILNKPLRSVS